MINLTDKLLSRGYENIPKSVRLGLLGEQTNVSFWDTSAGTGKLCILGHLGLVFIWSCFVSCLLFLLFYVSLRNLCSGTCRKIQFLNYGQTVSQWVRDMEI